MKKRELAVPSSDGIHTLHGIAVLPEGEPRGILLVLHGMTEYADRYATLLDEAAAGGYIAVSYDQLGHGRYAKEAGELGYIAKRGGWRFLTQDVFRVAEAVRGTFGRALPLVLMGHSMGSFAARVSVIQGFACDGLILSGTSGKHAMAPVGLGLIRCAFLFHSKRKPCVPLERLIFNENAKAFPEEHDRRAWVTKNKEVRRKRARDPLSNYRFTLSGLYDLVKLNEVGGRLAFFRAAGRQGMPVLLISGAEDPVGNFGKGIAEVERKLTKYGHPPRVILYPDARHNILDEDCHRNVADDILAFLGGVPCGAMTN